MNLLLKCQLQSHSVISFDIFDTLLVRPYMRPTDVFYHMEQVYQEHNFAQCRIQAEEKARLHYAPQEEITLDQIYEFMPDNYVYLKEKEVEFEMQVLQPNPQMKEVFETALKMGKKVIITSDMYLDIRVIHQILMQKGYVGFQKIYLSSDQQKTKETGHLFDYLVSDLKVSPKSILHIGDNKKSDVKIPRKKGIATHHYKSIQKQFLNTDKRLYQFWQKEQNNFEASLLLGVLALSYAHHKKRTFFQKLGYMYAGPTAYGYMHHLKEIALEHNIEQFLFIARDGYSLKKVFEILYPNQKSYYIYANRFLGDLINLSTENKLTATALIQYYQKKSDELKKLLQKNPNWGKNPLEFIKTNKTFFHELAAQELQNYQKYLTNIVDTNKKTIFIDTVTINFSAHNLLKQAGFSKNLKGYYWSVVESGKSYLYPHEAYGQERELPFSIFTKNWNFIEFIFSAPENPICGMNSEGLPVFSSHPSKYELYRQKVYPDISKGICEFTQDMQTFFGKNTPSFSISLVIKWLNHYFETLNYQDMCYLNKIYYSADSEHKEYSPLFLGHSFKRYFIDSLKKCFKKSWKKIRKKALKKITYISKQDLPPLVPSDYTLKDDLIDSVLRKLGSFSFCPNSGNMGDFIIAEAEYRLFQQKGYDYEIYDRSLLGATEQPKNFVYGGGGVFVSYWCPQNFIDLFKNKNIKNIVILSASFYNCPQLIEVLDERFTIFCREKFSYDYLMNAHTKARVYLSHDMALGLKPDFETQISVPQLNQFLETPYKRPMKMIYTQLYLPYRRVYDKLSFLLKESPEAIKIGYFLRTDVEGTKEVSALGIKDTFDISMCAIGLCSDPGMVHIYTQLFFAGLMAVDIVVTDRLHVGIGAALLGKEVVYLDNSYHKISGVYQNSMTDFKNVHLIAPDQLKSCLAKLKKTALSTHDAKPLKALDMDYADFLIQYLSYRQFQDQRIINVLWNT